MDRWIPAKTGNVSLGPAGIVGNYNDISCSGHLKRKSRTRSGCWWPGAGSTASLRRPWQSTVGARSRLNTWKMKFELIDNQARIGRGKETLNDKFQCLFIPRAKKSIITGAGPLRGQNEDPAKVDKINTNVGKATINYTTMLEPGSSREAVKDTPGKDNNFQFINTLFQGLVVAGGAGQACEDIQVETHGECGVLDGEVDGQTGHATQSRPGGEVCDGEQEQGESLVGHHQQHGDGSGLQGQRDEVQDVKLPKGQ